MNQPSVFAPFVHTRFTTRRLLVTEWVEGSTPDTVDLKEEKAKEMAQWGGQAVFRQIVGTVSFMRIRMQEIC